MTTETAVEPLTFDATDEDAATMREVLRVELTFQAAEYSLDTLEHYQRAREVLDRMIPVYEALEAGRILVTSEAIDAVARECAE